MSFGLSQKCCPQSFVHENEKRAVSSGLKLDYYLDFLYERKGGFSFPHTACTPRKRTWPCEAESGFIRLESLKFLFQSIYAKMLLTSGNMSCSVCVY